MESLKTENTDPIDLYECFKAFVREDQLGEDECWSVPGTECGRGGFTAVQFANYMLLDERGIAVCNSSIIIAVHIPRPWSGNGARGCHVNSYTVHVCSM